jgi:hypothetical protein
VRGALGPRGAGRCLVKWLYVQSLSGEVALLAATHLFLEP